MLRDSDSCRHLSPPRYKMAALTFLGLLAPVHFIPPAFQAALPGNHLLGVMLSVASIVLLMTYAIMPALTRASFAWLHSGAAGRHILPRRHAAETKEET